MIVARSIKIATVAVASTVLAAPICLILTVLVMCVPEASYLIPHYPSATKTRWNMQGPFRKPPPPYSGWQTLDFSSAFG